MGEGSETLDLEGPVRDELTSDLHVGEGALTQVRPREQPGLAGHGLAVLTDVVGRGDHTTGQGVVQGLVEALNNADDCGHFLPFPF